MKKTYDEFLAECYEAEDEFWKEVYEDLDADYLAEELENINFENHY